MNESQFSAPEPRRSSRAVVLLAAAVVVIFALVFARFAVMSGNGSLGTAANGSNLSQAGAFPTATPVSGAPSQAASGTVVAGAPQALVKIIAGYPRPDVDTAQQQNLRAQLSGNPSKVIMVSITGQFLQAYENGKLMRWTYVTTGRSGMETPTGYFKIGWKLSPFTFEPISTDPASPYFGYPSKVQYAMEFADGGYYIHDTWWRTTYGPPLTANHYDPGRGEYEEGSHGCVNTPLEMMTWLYTWASVGTPVIVYQ